MGLSGIIPADWLLPLPQAAAPLAHPRPLLSETRTASSRGLRRGRFLPLKAFGTNALCRAAALAFLLASHARAGVGPFLDLHAIEGVSTSRNGIWISVTISTDNYRAKVPGYLEAVSRGMGSDHDALILRVTCRAGLETEHVGPQPARAEILIPDHPSQRPHNWWSPMFWILSLVGTAVEETSVIATLAEASNPGNEWYAEQATLQRVRATYSARRTKLSVGIDGPAILDALAKGQSIKIQVSGEHTHIKGVFPAAPQLTVAVRKMMRHCPKPQVEESQVQRNPFLLAPGEPPCGISSSSRKHQG